MACHHMTCMLWYGRRKEDEWRKDSEEVSDWGQEWRRLGCCLGRVFVGRLRDKLWILLWSRCYGKTSGVTGVSDCSLAGVQDSRTASVLIVSAEEQMGTDIGDAGDSLSRLICPLRAKSRSCPSVTRRVESSTWWRRDGERAGKLLPC